MDNKTIAAELIDLLRRCDNPTKENKDAVYLAVDMISAASNGLVVYDGKLYSAAKPTLKGQHSKTGECSFGGFYEKRTM